MWKNYRDVLHNAEHYIALGQTEIYLDSSDPDLPWGAVKSIETGGAYRLNGPTGFYVVAKEGRLTFKWNVDFESRGSNGEPVHLFDRKRLRDTMRKLPPAARLKLAKWLEKEVLPGVEKVTKEWQGYLDRQRDREDIVRGLILYGAEESTRITHTQEKAMKLVLGKDGVKREIAAPFGL